MRCFCIHEMNDFELRLAWLWGDPLILICADKISNQNGFDRVHLLLLDFQWYLHWELQILLQDWPLKSAQIGKNDIQFPANFYVSYSLVCVCFYFTYVWTCGGKSLHIDSERDLVRLIKVLKALVFTDNKISVIWAATFISQSTSKCSSRAIRQLHLC